MELLWRAAITATATTTEAAQAQYQTSPRSNSPSITIFSCSGPWLHPLDIWHQMDGIHNMCSSHVAAMLYDNVWIPYICMYFYYWRRYGLDVQNARYLHETQSYISTVYLRSLCVRCWQCRYPGAHPPVVSWSRAHCAQSVLTLLHGHSRDTIMASGQCPSLVKCLDFI